MNQRCPFYSDGRKHWPCGSSRQMCWCRQFRTLLMRGRSINLTKILLLSRGKEFYICVQLPTIRENLMSTISENTSIKILVGKRKLQNVKICMRITQKCVILSFLCWNHQIWSNLNTFVITGRGVGGLGWGWQTWGKKIYRRNANMSSCGRAPVYHFMMTSVQHSGPTTQIKFYHSTNIKSSTNRQSDV